MAQETFDYSAMLADARAKRAALDAFITSLENAQALGALGQAVPGGSASTGGFTPSGGPAVELPMGALMGKSVSNAIKLYLAACKKKQTVREITDALKEGGVESTSKNFEIIVRNTLRILKAANTVLQFKDGWALAELYPEAIRARISQQQDGPKAPGKKRKKRKKAKAKKESPAIRSSKPEVKLQEMPKAS